MNRLLGAAGAWRGQHRAIPVSERKDAMELLVEFEVEVPNETPEAIPLAPHPNDPVRVAR